MSTVLSRPGANPIFRPADQLILLLFSVQFVGLRRCLPGEGRTPFLFHCLDQAPQELTGLKSAPNSYRGLRYTWVPRVLGSRPDGRLHREIYGVGPVPARCLGPGGRAVGRAVGSSSSAEVSACDGAVSMSEDVRARFVCTMTCTPDRFRSPRRPREYPMLCVCASGGFCVAGLSQRKPY